MRDEEERTITSEREKRQVHIKNFGAQDGVSCVCMVPNVSLETSEQLAVGRRIHEVNVLGGLILPTRGTIEKALSKQARKTHKQIRVLRIETTKDKQRVVGLLVPNGAVDESVPRQISGRGRGGAAERPRGGIVGRCHGLGRGRGRGRGCSEPISAEALDADLDKYHTEAMQTN